LAGLTAVIIKNPMLYEELPIYWLKSLDIEKPNETSNIIIPEDGLMIEPGRLYPGRTLKYTNNEGYVIL